MKRLLLCTALIAAAHVAQAADLPPALKALRATPVPLGDWTGFYIGGHGGYGWGNTSVDDPFSLTGFTFTSLLPDPKPKGGVFGGHAGYNWQSGSLVGGVEVDLDAATIRQQQSVALSPADTFTRKVKLDELTSARGRFGYLISPDLFAYGTGGIAWGHAAAEVALTSGTAAFSESTNAGLLGWVAGAGLEYKLVGNLLLRGEYLHYDFARAAFNFPVPSMGGVFFSTNARSEVDIVRGGLSYKF